MFAKDWSHIANIWYLKAKCIWWSGIISAFREFFKVPWEFQPKSMYRVFFLLFLPFTLLASVNWQPDDRIISTRNPYFYKLFGFLFSIPVKLCNCFFPTKNCNYSIWSKLTRTESGKREFSLHFLSNPDICCDCFPNLERWTGREPSKKTQIH